MRKETEILIKVIPEGLSVEEAVDFLVESGVIHRNAHKYAEIYLKWEENCKEVGKGKAVVRTSIQMGVSDRAIYHARNRFEKP